MIAIGDLIGGRYLVRAFLGEGGMGAVYRVTDTKLGEDVALKVMRRASLDAALRDEVRLAQRVTHVNVCRTYDLEEVDGHHFVKMEYIAGETLAARLRDGRLAIDEATRIARAIADGLAAAHAQGIVHRDLKPGNVMLAGDRVVLMDFGIARHVASPDDGLAGTVGYMAPEQLHGDAVDARADLYALGCVVYEMLAGEPVFGTGKALDLAVRHASNPPPDVRAKRPDAPRWLARAVDGLLAKAPVEREPALALLRAGPRSRARIALFVAVVAAAAGFAGWRLTRPAPWQPHIVDMPPYQENGDTPRWSPDGSQIAFLSDRGTPNSFRIYVMNRDGSGAHAVTSDGVDVGAPAWTRDGTSLLYSRDGTIVRHRLADGAIEVLGPGSAPYDCGDSIVMIDRTGGASRIALRSADGSRRVLAPARPIEEGLDGPECDRSGKLVVFTHGRLTTAASSDVAVSDRDGHVTELTHDHHATRGATFTPDGRSVVFAALRDGHRRLYEVAVTGGDDHALTGDDDWDIAPDVSADGEYVVFDRDTTSENLWEGGAGAEPRRITTDRDTLAWIRPVPGTRLVVAEHVISDGIEIVAIDTASGERRSLARGHSPFPSLDGTVVYFQRTDGTALEAIPIAGGAERTVATLPGMAFGYDTASGIRLGHFTDKGIVTLRIDGGRALAEPEPGFSLPAPRGPLRLVMQREGRALHLRVFEPGTETPIRDVVARSYSPLWLDDRRFSYCGDTACTIVDVTDPARDRELPAPPGYLTRDAVVALDGSRWYATPAIGNVTRHILANFGHRPWR